MIETKLKKIASDENGEYTIDENIRSFTDGSRSPETHYNVRFEYKNSKIKILIKVGVMDTSRIVITLSNYTLPIEFEVNSVSPFINLFLRRKTRFKVKCENKNFKHFLKNKALSVFENSMKSKNFDPRVFTQKKNSVNEIILEFHLCFENWIEIFHEINNFLKLVIDELNSDNRFMSNKTYKEKTNANKELC